ncbi:MAG: hypothetical protein ACYS15_06395 [Planctomycetota bacterium]
MHKLGFLVLLLALSPTCPFDLDGDGDVGITDFLSLLAQWGTDPAGPPDFDGDGLGDGDEVLGTAGGLELPAMGANALHQDIFIEADWMFEDEGGPSHTHRPLR